MTELSYKLQQNNTNHESAVRKTHLDTLLIGDVNLTNVESKLDLKCQVRTIGEMKKWLQSHKNIYAKMSIVHLNNQEVFNFSQDEEKNPEDIIISRLLHFNKTGIVYTKIKSFMTSINNILF